MLSLVHTSNQMIVLLIMMAEYETSVKTQSQVDVLIDKLP